MSTTNLAQAIERLEKRSGAIHGRLLKLPSAKKFFTRSNLLAYRLRQKSSQILAGAGLIGAIITMPAPQSFGTIEAPTAISPESSTILSNHQKLLGVLHEIIPHQPAKFTSEKAAVIEKLLYENLRISTKAVLDDQSLNHQVGYIGAEQHLKRFPGDTLAGHDELQSSGMAPGLGAFGYFTKDSQSFTTRDYLREKYYCAVQTLYLPEWNKNSRFLKDWYKFRKIIVVNPINGLATVCDIADAGPANWTGKQFGGSPEVMESLKLNGGPRKGLVLILFVDDPDNQVPLGPVNY